jgi:hypothetical protein
MMRTECMAGMSADAMSHGSLAIALSCRGHKTASCRNEHLAKPHATHATGRCD